VLHASELALAPVARINFVSELEFRELDHEKIKPIYIFLKG
jgi:hypothetical protein